MTKEIRWLPVVGFEGRYEVSNTGLVRSLDRFETVAVRGGGVGKRFYKGAIKSSEPDAYGYPTVHLRAAGRSKKPRVHVVMLEAFVGPRPPGMDGCHNDGNKLHCRLSNLRWDTPAANAEDKRLHGTNHELNKTECPSGHRYDDANTIVTTKGHRQCHKCATTWRQERRQRVRQAHADLREWCASNGVSYQGVQDRFHALHGKQLRKIRDDEAAIRNLLDELKVDQAAAAALKAAAFLEGNSPTVKRPG